MVLEQAGRAAAGPGGLVSTMGGWWVPTVSQAGGPAANYVVFSKEQATCSVQGTARGVRRPHEKGRLPGHRACHVPTTGTPFVSKKLPRKLGRARVPVAWE